MLWVVCYDIVNDKRRREVVKVLEGYGKRGQYSVFECHITDDQQKRLQDDLHEVIDTDEDDVRFYPLNAADQKRIKCLGTAIIYIEKDATII